MSEVREEKGLYGLVKTLGEIGGYVTSIAAFILAITGRAPTPYPASIALLTILVTVVVLWIWRWSRITLHKIKDGQDADRKGVDETYTSGNNLFDPFKTNSRHSYQRPLIQRRVEGILLLSLSLAGISVGYTKIPTVRAEISGLNCLNTPRDVHLLIADFSPQTGRQFENSLANRILIDYGDLFQVCRYGRPVVFVSDAQAIRSKYNMDLVIWGTYSNDLYEVSLTSAPDFVLTQEHGLPVYNTPDQVAFLTADIVSDIRFVHNDTAGAKSILLLALDTARSQDWEKNNPALLADGYFSLALVLSAEVIDDSSRPMILDAYSRAIELDPEMDAALVNRAALYWNEGDLDEAIADYSSIIDHQGSLATEALLLRGAAHLKQGDCGEAIPDLERVLHDPLMDENNYEYPDAMHNLGMAYLLCNKYEQAEQIYGELIPSDAADFPGYMEELDGMAQNAQDPGLKDAIQTILAGMKKMQSP